MCQVILNTEDCCDDGDDAHDNFAEHESRDDEENMKGQKSQGIVCDCHGYVFLF